VLFSWEDFGKYNPNEKGGHTPCQDICGGRQYVMYVARLRRSMPLSGRETIGQRLGRHGPAWRNNRVKRRVQFYDEREWRYVPEPLFLDWKDYLDKSKRTELHKRFERKYALRISPGVIQYLIVPYDKDEKNILELHNYLMRLYSRKDAILVTTAIMTVDRIQKDV